eukprot:TRINITY_DN4606_c0_g1_i4.p3 TRINITY_DN4606_c0_g1~~TRINITY_DN4606_c0_g1_i4.p3  ORF type:complete len:121 (+),score=8.26 TRINITY_DN4606_c0_g1_i4:945-1307(+)
MKKVVLPNTGPVYLQHGVSQAPPPNWDMEVHLVHAPTRSRSEGMKHVPSRPTSAEDLPEAKARQLHPRAQLLDDSAQAIGHYYDMPPAQRRKLLENHNPDDPDGQSEAQGSSRGPQAQVR